MFCYSRNVKKLFKKWLKMMKTCPKLFKSQKNIILSPKSSNIVFKNRSVQQEGVREHFYNNFTSSKCLGILPACISVCTRETFIMSAWRLKIAHFDDFQSEFTRNFVQKHKWLSVTRGRGASLISSRKSPANLWSRKWKRRIFGYNFCQKRQKILRINKIRI